MQKVVKRAIKMADRAETRLQNKGDAAIAAQVKRVFQLDMTSAGDQLDLGFVQSVFSTIKNIKVVGGDNKRAASDIRFYCDDDKRWEPVSNINDPKAPKNSDRDDDTIELEDKKNHFRLPIGGIKKSCRAKSPPLAIRYGTKLHSPSSPSEENSDREMLTICKSGKENVFQLSEFKDTDLTRIDEDINLGPTDYLDMWTYQTIIHELTHAAWIADSDDDHPSGSNGYGWKPLQALSRAETLKNADSFAYFASLTGLLDLQWKLSTNEEDAKKGLFVKDTSLPLHIPSDSDE